MTIPSSYKVSTTDNTNTSPVESIGGAAIGITSATTTTAGSPITRTFDLKDQGVDGVSRRTAPKDTANTVEALAATGTFAYDQSAFMIIGNQANNKINNSASTALVMNGNDASVDSNRASVKPIGGKTLTAFAAQRWMPLGISGQRTNWSVAPTAMNATSFYDPATGSETAVPDGAVGTRAVPGELTYMYGAIDPNQDDYSARTGM